MTDHTTYRPRLPAGSDGDGWRSVAGTLGAFAKSTANAMGTGADDANGASVPTDFASVSIAA